MKDQDSPTPWWVLCRPKTDDTNARHSTQLKGFHFAADEKNIDWDLLSNDWHYGYNKMFDLVRHWNNKDTGYWTYEIDWDKSPPPPGLPGFTGANDVPKSAEVAW